MGRARQTNKEGWVRTRGKPKGAAAVTVREVDMATVFDVNGQLTHQLGLKMRQAVEAGRRHLLVNLTNVTYIDSAGVGELIRVMTSLRSRGGQLKLCGLPEKVWRVLRAANLDKVLEIHPDEAAALASFSEASRA